MPAAILDQIVEAKREDLARRKKEAPLSELDALVREAPVPLNLSGALWGERPRLIAETKKTSPSKGLLAQGEYDPAALAAVYAANGAAAVSVLTESAHFRGSLAHLAAVKAAVAPEGLPVLRKDFLFDPYQLSEARANGADAALLIVAILERERLREMLDAARGIWLQCLVEAHDEREVEAALDAGAEIVGINQRDLRTFEVDTTLAARLRPLVPPGRMVVAESGVSSRDDVAALHRAGVNGVLVGEALMTAPDAAAKTRELAGAQ